MELIIVFALLTVLNVFLLIFFKGRLGKAQRTLIYFHIVALVVFIVDSIVKIYFGMSLRTGWADRIILLFVFFSAASIFALYCRRFNWPAKIYFGFYFFYPCFAAGAFFADRIFGVLVGIPLVFGLMIPIVSYRDEQYELREWGGGLAPVRIRLVEMYTFTERELGRSYQEFSPRDKYEQFRIVSLSSDSIIAISNVNGKQEKIVFKK